MSLALTQEIKHAFDLAALRYEASKLLISKDWQEFQKIKNSYATERQLAEDNYVREYDRRVEVARKKLIAKAGQKNRDFKHRLFGTDKFDKATITRQAHAQVRYVHHALLLELETKEKEAVRTLLARCEVRQNTRATKNDDESERTQMTEKQKPNERRRQR